MNNFSFTGILGVILVLVSSITDLNMEETDISILLMFFIGIILLTNSSPAVSLAILITLKSQFFGFVDTSEFIRLIGILNSGDIVLLSIIIVSVFRIVTVDRDSKPGLNFYTPISIILVLILFQIIYSSFITDHSTLDEAFRSGRNHLTFALYFFIIPLFDLKEIKIFIKCAICISTIMCIVFILNNISSEDITTLKKGLDVYFANIKLRRTYILIQPVVDLVFIVSFISILIKDFSKEWMRFPGIWFLITSFSVFIFISRGWWFTIFLLIIMTVYFLVRYKVEISQRVIKFVSMASIVVVLLSGTLIASMFSNRLEDALADLSGENPGTFAHRMVQIERGFEFLNTEAPFFGVGYTAFTSKITQHLAGRSFGIDDKPSEYIFWGSNDFGILSTLFSFGYLGAVIFYISFFILVYRCFQIIRNTYIENYKLMILSLALAIIATFLNGLTGGFMFEPAVPIFIASACGFVDILKYESESGVELIDDEESIIHEEELAAEEA